MEDEHPDRQHEGRDGVQDEEHTQHAPDAVEDEEEMDAADREQDDRAEDSHDHENGPVVSSHIRTRFRSKPPAETLVGTRDSGGKGSHVGRLRPRGRVSLVVAILLLVVVPLVPGALAEGSPAPLIGLPVESIVVLLLLCLLPWRPARVVVAVGFGVVIVIGLVLAGIDAGYRSVLDIPFDPLDWQQLGDAFGVVQGSIGGAAASRLVVLLALAAAGSIVALTWAALRAGAAVRPDRAHGTIVISAVAAAWAIAALTGSQPVAGQPAAAAASLHAITASASHAAAGLAALADLPQQIATDPYRDAPGSDLLTSLQGKDVVFAFIESYGRVAVQGSSFSGGVDQVLRDGEAQLRADGYASQSAFLTSPTFGGLSWLAHSTFQTGLWVDRQPLYSEVIRSDRFTLSEAFGRAGWRTVSVVPSNSEPWSFGTSFYRFDTLLDANNVGYRGPSFGYARIPDQYTWKYFADHELAADHQPVMAEIDLVSSHTPWAPLPELVPWSQVGDGSVFGPQPDAGGVGDHRLAGPEAGAAGVRRVHPSIRSVRCSRSCTSPTTRTSCSWCSATTSRRRS